eukprot:271106_1
MLNLLQAITKHTPNFTKSGTKCNKFDNVQQNLGRVSFRMLILSISIVGKMISIPTIRSLLKHPNYIAFFLGHFDKALECYYKLRNWSIDALQHVDPTVINRHIQVVIDELETKPANKCVICKEPVSVLNFLEHNTCISCQDKHKINDHIPASIRNLAGKPIDDTIHAYKYHKYLFENKTSLSMTAQDFEYLRNTIKHSKSEPKMKPIPRIDLDNILRNERELQQHSKSNIDPDVCFHIVLLSVSHQFIRYTLNKFGGLFGPRLMPVLLIDREYGEQVAQAITRIPKDQYLRLVVDHIADNNQNTARMSPMLISNLW